MYRKKTAPWWPPELGTPSTFGASDELRYAYFPQLNRLALDRGGVVVLYDTGVHQFRGAIQTDGADGELSFASQAGRVAISQLTVVDSLEDVRQAREPGDESAA